MNQMAGVPEGTFLRSKQTVTVAIDLLNWLHERGTPLAEVQQADVDQWVIDGSSTHLLVDRFLGWAAQSHCAPGDLVVARHRRGTSTKLDVDAQRSALVEVLDTDHLNPRDRAAAILVLVFGQPLERIVSLRWTQVLVTDEVITITLADVAIGITAPLDEAWRLLESHPGREQTAAHPRPTGSSGAKAPAAT